jgi:hypothetical protein
LRRDTPVLTVCQEAKECVKWGGCAGITRLLWWLILLDYRIKN